MDFLLITGFHWREKSYGKNMNFKHTWLFHIWTLFTISACLCFSTYEIITHTFRKSNEETTFMWITSHVQVTWNINMNKTCAFNSRAVFTWMLESDVLSEHTMMWCFLTLKQQCVYHKWLNDYVNVKESTHTHVSAYTLLSLVCFQLLFTVKKGRNDKASGSG